MIEAAVRATKFTPAADVCPSRALFSWIVRTRSHLVNRTAAK